MEPTLEMVAGVQTSDVLPSIDRLEKQVADIKGDIVQLFDRLNDLAEEVDALKKG
tara:strand:- start:234 stop:398 length:165 start_codon:yes stop_codon:yes gene_type:complete